MPRPSQFVQLVVHCGAPNCDHIKGPVNHWWICHITHERFLLKPWDDDAIDSEDNIIPLCGSACATIMFSKFMSDLQAANPAKETFSP
jgi:hypothetical protein